MIEGKNRPIQVFLDSGCNTALVKEGVPQSEFNSILLKEGPITLDLATGVTTDAGGEWGMALPLSDGSFQAVRALSVKEIASRMPHKGFKPALRRVQDQVPDN